MTNNRLAAPLVVGIAAVLLVSGCSFFAPAERQPLTAPDPGPTRSDGTPIVPQPPFAPHTAAPLPEFDRSDDAAVSAAHDLIQANYDAIAAGDWAGACALYSDAYVQNRIIPISQAPADSTCEEAIGYAFETAAEYVASFKDSATTGRYIEQQLMPFYYVPTEISIDDAELTADNEGLVYGTGMVVHGSAAYSFKDDEGSYARPGFSAPWQVAAQYFAEVDGAWMYIDMSEKSALE